jgi:uncharacterized phage-associated protein
MIPYRKEKRENTICYFATEHYNKTGKYLSQTILFKYLAYLDFSSLKDIGRPALEFEYKAMKNGPVPHKLYNMRRNYKSRLVEFVPRGNEKYIIKAKKNTNLDYFSKYEIEKMDELVKKYADPNKTEKENTDKICDDSHKDIRAYDVAYKREENSKIEYEDTFENIFNKKERELLPAEENFLLYLH